MSSNGNGSTLRRRVVMTGIGAITPIGITKDAMWSGLRAERSAVSGLTRFDPTPFRSHSSAEVDFVATDQYEEFSKLLRSLNATE